MNQEFVNLKDQQVLFELKNYLEQINVASSFLESSVDLPYNILVAVTPAQASINIMYVPIPEDHFEEIRLLQLYSLVITNIVAERKIDLLILINELNNRCAIGSFFINERSEFGFKYIYPISRFDIPQKSSFIDIFSLFLNSMMSFRDLIIQVNNGTLLLDDAFKKLGINKN